MAKPGIPSAGSSVCPGEGGGGLQGGVGLVEQRGETLEDVRDLRPDLQLDRHVLLGGASRQP
jgi:hypothetical protein